MHFLVSWFCSPDYTCSSSPTHVMVMNHVLIVFSLLKFLLCQLLLQNYWFPWIHLVAVLSNLHLSSLIYFWNSAEEFQDKWSFPAFPNTESINLFTFLQGSLFHATNFPASFLSFCSPINLHSMFSASPLARLSSLIDKGRVFLSTAIWSVQKHLDIAIMHSQCFLIVMSCYDGNSS